MIRVLILVSVFLLASIAAKSMIYDNTIPAKKLLLSLDLSSYRSLDNIQEMLKQIHQKDPSVSFSLFADKRYEDNLRLTLFPPETNISFLEEVPDFLQDQIEIDKNKNVISLPTHENEELVKKIAEQINSKIVIKATTDIPYDGENLGGNIEFLPNELLVTGQGISKELFEFFSARSKNAEQIDVSWLYTGHVDELFNVVPMENGRFAILYASPELAIDVAGGMDTEEVLEPNYFIPVNGRPAIYYKRVQKGCLASIASVNIWKSRPMTVADLSSCSELVEYNMKIGRMIKSSLQKITSHLDKENFVIVPLPQLFLPVRSLAKDKTQAIAINPNTVNGISLNKLFVLPEQTSAEFNKKVEEKLEEIGITPILSKDEGAYRKKGGLHCRSYVLREKSFKFQ